MPITPREAPRDHLALRLAGRLLGAAIIGVTLALGVYVARLYYYYPQTDDAYVRANIVHVAPRVSGPIVDLPIHDNQHVRKGELLFVVDPRPYQAALQMAQAKLELTDLDIKALDNAIAAAKARQTQLEAGARYDKEYLDRLVPLLKEQFVTADQVYNARSKLAAGKPASITPATRSTRRKTSSASSAISTLGARLRKPPFMTRGSMSITATRARRLTPTSPT